MNHEEAVSGLSRRRPEVERKRRSEAAHEGVPHADCMSRISDGAWILSVIALAGRTMVPHSDVSLINFTRECCSSVGRYLFLSQRVTRVLERSHGAAGNTTGTPNGQRAKCKYFFCWAQTKRLPAAATRSGSGTSLFESVPAVVFHEFKRTPLSIMNTRSARQRAVFTAPETA